MALLGMMSMWSKRLLSKRLWRYYLQSAERMVKLFRIINITFLLGSTSVILVLISLFTPLFSQAIVYMFSLLPLPNMPPAAKSSPPTAYVVLGGGLTNDHNNQIILNSYSLIAPVLLPPLITIYRCLLSSAVPKRRGSVNGSSSMALMD